MKKVRLYPSSLWPNIRKSYFCTCVTDLSTVGIIPVIFEILHLKKGWKNSPHLGQRGSFSRRSFSDSIATKPYVPYPFPWLEHLEIFSMKGSRGEKMSEE